MIITVSQLIEHLEGIEDAENVTEIHEQDDRMWAKGMTYMKNGKHENNTQKDTEWTKRREGEASSVFLRCKRG